MLLRPLLVVTFLFPLLLAAAVVVGPTRTANAAPGVAKGSVNLRAGPGTNYARIATIPAGARVNVLRCGRWCEVIYAGRRGWASASYIARGAAPRGGYVVILPDRSLCHGPGVWSNPYCEWPIERSAREFSNSTREFNARMDRRR
jgi:uncharacterized protein YraI